MQVQELVGIVPWTFIAQICNLFLQMYLIKRFLFKPVNEMLQKKRSNGRCRNSGCHKGEKEAIAMKTSMSRICSRLRQKQRYCNEAQRTASLQSEEILKVQPRKPVL